MALFGNNKEIAALKSELDDFKATVFNRNARLKGYGPAIAEELSPGVSISDPVVNEQQSVTNVGDIYQIHVDNWPGNAQVTLVALAHPEVTSGVWYFTSGLGADLDEFELAEMEDWVKEATTGTAVDHNRHASRANRLAGLVRG